MSKLMKKGTYVARNFELCVCASGATLLHPKQPQTTLLRTGTLQLDQLRPDFDGDTVKVIGARVEVFTLFGRPMPGNVELLVQRTLDKEFDHFEGKVVYR